MPKGRDAEQSVWQLDVEGEYGWSFNGQGSGLLELIDRKISPRPPKNYYQTPQLPELTVFEDIEFFSMAKNYTKGRFAGLGANAPIKLRPLSMTDKAQR